MAKRGYIRHDLVTLRSHTWKRRSLVDRRSHAGQNAIRIQQQLIQDNGVAENMSTAKLMLVELIYVDGESHASTNHVRSKVKRCFICRKLI